MYWFGSKMTGKSLGLRLASTGSLQLQHSNGVLQIQTSPVLTRKTSKSLLSTYREKERCLSYVFRCLCRRKVGMMVLFLIAVLACVSGFFSLSRETLEKTNPIIIEGLQRRRTHDREAVTDFFFSNFSQSNREKHNSNSVLNTLMSHDNKTTMASPQLDSRVFKGYRPEDHPCRSFALPPPPPSNKRRIGPRPCPVCYLSTKQAKASMPIMRSASPVLHNLTYVHAENYTASESFGGSSFGGYPSLKQRNDSFDIKESMTVHCGFVKGRRPGLESGFDIDEADLLELGRFHKVIVASAIFGNYDIIQQPTNVSKDAKKHVPFYMFIDEETEEYMKGSGALNSSRRIGIWKIIVVHNIPYEDARRNGKIPKLLLHRLFTNVRYSIWIDGKLKLVADPYQILERFLWRQNATFAISRHYRRFDVFEEAKANKAAGKYSNASIDFQVDFYRKEGLTHYSEAKLPITSDVPEGCVIIREHIPITNLFTCLWFNEVDRFTSRDQLSFSTVRDKIMSKVNWSINMFLDCERRNFVVQQYHRELLENMPPPPPPSPPPPPPRKPALLKHSEASYGKVSKRRREKDKKSASKRNRKIASGNREANNKLIEHFGD